METPFLAWLNSYSVGHPGLDAQHSQLVALINAIHSAEYAAKAHDELQALLHAFKLAAVNHYKNENSIMRLLGDYAEKSESTDSALLKALGEARINEHYADHARSLVALDSIIHGSGDVTAPQNYSVRLRAWFIEHASTSDVHLKAIFDAPSRD